MAGRNTNYESVQSAILSTASILFTKNGVRGTSLNDIAKEAGLSKGTLYYYYPTKELLILDVAQAHCSEISNTIFNWIDAISRDCEIDTALQLLLDALLDDAHIRTLQTVLLCEGCMESLALREFLADRLSKWTVMVEVGTLKIQNEAARLLRERAKLFFTMVLGAMLRPELTPEDKESLISLLLS